MFIRQIVAPQGFVDIVVLDGYSYEIRCYASDSRGAKQADGTYAVTGTPERVIHVEDLDRQPGPVTNLKFTVLVNSNVLETHTYVLDASNGCTLTSDALGVRRIDDRRSVVSGATRTETRTIQNELGQLVSTEVLVFQTFPWNAGSNPDRVEELVSRTIDPAGAAERTTYSYYQDPGDAANYGRVKMKTEPGGFWEIYEYDTAGRVIRTRSPFLNSTPADIARRVRQTIHHDAEHYDEEVESLVLANGTVHEISRTYHVFDSQQVRTVRCQTAGALPDAADNLVSTVAYYGESDPVSFGKIAATIQPNDSGALYTYVESGGQLTTTVWEGAFDAARTAVVAGVKTERTVNRVGELIAERRYDIASNLLLSSATATSVDDVGRVLVLSYSDGTNVRKSYDCCGLESLADREGVVTNYGYDGAHRLVRETRAGVTMRYSYDAADRPTATTRIGSDGVEMAIEATSYDAKGEVQSTTAFGMRTTNYSKTLDAIGQTIRTTISPDGGTRIETRALDGSVVRVSGTAVSPRVYEYGADEDGVFVKEIRVGEAGALTEWTKTSTDLLGRAYKTTFPDGAVMQSWFNAVGQLTRTMDADGVTTLFSYDAQGQTDSVAIDMNRNGVIDLDGSDRVTRTRREAPVMG